jgi:hypothetical protein
MNLPIMHFPPVSHNNSYIQIHLICDLWIYYIYDKILNFPVAHIRYVHIQCLHFMLMPFYRIFHCIHSMLQSLPWSDGSCMCACTQAHAHTAVFYRTFTITYTCQWTPSSHTHLNIILQSVPRYLNGSFTVKRFVLMEINVTFWHVGHDTMYQHTQDNSLNLVSSKALGFHKRIV